MYGYDRTKSHVIIFDQIGVESRKLELNGDSTFSMSFTDSGKFSYQCGIQTRMEGIIEVLDDKNDAFCPGSTSLGLRSNSFYTDS